MKNVVIFISLFVISLGTFAQNKKAYSVGVIVAPIAGFDFDKPEDGLTNYSVMFGVINIDWKKAGVNIMYSHKNQVAIAHYRSVTESVGWYIVANKNIMVDQNYIGTGFNYAVRSSFLFMEIGSSFTSWTPGAYVGVLIPFYIKKK